jgi:sugar phosphate isomerase/epimerase
MSEQPVTRREFAKRSGILAAGAAVAATGLDNIAAAAPKRGVYLGCRDVHLKQVAQPDCWSAMRAIDAESVEATVNDDLTLTGLFHPRQKYSLASPAAIDALRADMQTAGRRITALCMHNHFDARVEFEIQWATQAARAAQALEIPAIRIDVVPHKVPAGEFLAFAVATLRKLIAATESTGVAFAVENHSTTTNDPEFLHPLFERVGSKRLGLTLDTGNFYWFGHPLSKVYELYESFAPRVLHTHCKSIRYPEAEREKRRKMGWEYGKYNCPLYEGDIDFRRVAKILRQAGYANDLCVENESLGKFPADQRGAILAKEIQHLGHAWQAVGTA